MSKKIYINKKIIIFYINLKLSYIITIMSVNWNDINDAPLFSFEGQEIECKVVSVYDGDTVKIVFPLNNTLYKWNCRLQVLILQK